MNKLIELKNLTKNFDDQQVLRGINLDIHENEFLTLLGPSGCGKTTTLRIIAGFEEPSGGEVLFNGIEISKLPPYKREINTVFQKYALFPHLNVFENIAFGLRMQRRPDPADPSGKKKVKIPEKEIHERVMEMLEIISLKGFENRKPKHRREDGSFPQVKLLFAERRECGKALALARRIDHEYAEEAEKRKSERRMFPMPDFQPGDPAAAYYAHLENIRRHLTIEDYSRVDAMIALRLRSSGHSRERVEETIRACAPTIRETRTGRNWQRYAERTADYAFGPAGDRDLERNERYRDLWKKIENGGYKEKSKTGLRLG